MGKYHRELSSEDLHDEYKYEWDKDGPNGQALWKEIERRGRAGDPLFKPYVASVHYAGDVPAGPVGDGEGPPMDYDTDYGTTAIADHGNSSHSIARRLYADDNSQISFDNKTNPASTPGSGIYPEVIEPSFSIGYAGSADQAPSLRGPQAWDAAAAPKPQPKGASLRAEARHFIAEQECDDLRELTIRAKNHAERIASTLPVSQSAATVRAFVEAVRREAERSYSIDHYKEYANRNGLNPGDKLTADRYSRDHSVPKEVADNYADKAGRGWRGSNRTASIQDFPADLMFLE